MNVSVVIPVLNEAALLPSMLEHWRTLIQDGAEVLFVDGGSTDSTLHVLEDAGFQVIKAARGRARQMNAGATATLGDVLVFLHADTIPPPEMLSILSQALKVSNRVWGRFDVQIAGDSCLFRLIATLMNIRSSWTGIATGDQTIFVRRSAFEKVGQYPEQDLMEDIEISDRLLKISRPLSIKSPVICSARRWETRGIWRTIFLMWRLRWDYWRGVSASEIARAYR